MVGRANHGQFPVYEPTAGRRTFSFRNTATAPLEVFLKPADGSDAGAQNRKSAQDTSVRDHQDHKPTRAQPCSLRGLDGHTLPKRGELLASAWMSFIEGAQGAHAVAMGPLAPS